MFFKHKTLSWEWVGQIFQMHWCTLCRTCQHRRFGLVARQPGNETHQPPVFLQNLLLHLSMKNETYTVDGSRIFFSLSVTFSDMIALTCLLVSWRIIHRSRWNESAVFRWLAQFYTWLLSSIIHCWALAKVCALLLAILVSMLFPSFKSAVISVSLNLQVSFHVNLLKKRSLLALFALHTSMHWLWI